MARQMSLEENIVQATHDHFRSLFAKKHADLKMAQRSKPGLIQYAPLFILAGFKDSIDLVFLGSLPGPGTVITLCISLLMFLLYMSIKGNRQLLDSGFLIRRGLIMIGMFCAESIPFLNFLPLETTTVFVIYMMDCHLSEKHVAQILGILQLLHGEEGRTMRNARRLQKQHDVEEQAAAMAASQAEATNEAQYQQEIADDPQYGGVALRKFV